jgi:hypothetical protein
MSLTATAKWIPPARVAIVTASDGRRCTMGNVATQADVQNAIDFAVARWTAEDEAAAREAAEREARRQAWESDISAEAVKQAVAKAAATPHFAGSLTFLKLIKHKETCPYFAEILAEMERLRDASPDNPGEEE